MLISAWGQGRCSGSPRFICCFTLCSGKPNWAKIKCLGKHTEKFK